MILKKIKQLEWIILQRPAENMCNLLHLVFKNSSSWLEYIQEDFIYSQKRTLYKWAQQTVGDFIFAHSKSTKMRSLYKRMPICVNHMKCFSFPINDFIKKSKFKSNRCMWKRTVIDKNKGYNSRALFLNRGVKMGQKTGSDQVYISMPFYESGGKKRGFISTSL